MCPRTRRVGRRLCHRSSTDQHIIGRFGNNSPADRNISIRAEKRTRHVGGRVLRITKDRVELEIVTVDKRADAHTKSFQGS